MASAAHVYGKPIVAAESFSTWPYNGAWRNHPFSLKMLGDTAFTYGVNRLVFHRFVHQPWLHLRPGMTLAYWGVHYERTQTWWEYSKPWHDYVTRCQYLLQSGKFVADLCYLTDEGAYNEPLTRDQLDPARPEGYDYDLAPPEAAFSRMSVTNGRIVLPDGTSYAALVLPNQPTMTPALLRRIKILVDQGAVVVGKPPTRSPSLAHYPECDREVMALANELWGDANQEKTMEKSMDSRRLIWGGSLEQLFAGLKLGPDFRTIEKTEKPLRYLHRTNPNGDIYFVANPMSNQVTATCEFRILDKTPEVWEPDSGQVRRLAAWKRTSSGTQIQLSFQPFGSCFVVFGNAPKSVDPVVDFSLNQRPHPTAGLTLGEDGQVQLAAEKPGLYEAIRSSGERLEGQLTLPPKSTIIQGPWTVEFPRPDGTALQVAMDKLSPWNEHSHPEVRFFSGAATYRQRVEMVHGAGSNSLALDLGKVAVLADVKINGRSAGTLWKPPFSVEVGHLLKRGANEVEITVVNLWPNRMIGDEHLPSDCEWSADTPGDLGNRLVRWPDWFRESRPRPTQRQTFATRRFYDKNAPLIESGLLGPVVLREVPVVRLEPED
jgi:hypothetical protein